MEVLHSTSNEHYSHINTTTDDDDDCAYNTSVNNSYATHYVNNSTTTIIERCNSFLSVQVVRFDRWGTTSKYDLVLYAATGPDILVYFPLLGVTIAHEKSILRDDTQITGLRVISDVKKREKIGKKGDKDGNEQNKNIHKLIVFGSKQLSILCIERDLTTVNPTYKIRRDNTLFLDDAVMDAIIMEGKDVGICTSDEGSTILAVALCNNAVELWNIPKEDNKPDCRPELSPNLIGKVKCPIRCMTYSMAFCRPKWANGKLVVASGTIFSDVVVWIIDGKDECSIPWNREGDVLGILKGHTGVVLQVRWSLSGRELTSVSDDRSIRVWRAGLPPLVLFGHTARVWDALPFGTDKIASVAEDTTLRIWKRNPTPSSSTTYTTIMKEEGEMKKEKSGYSTRMHHVVFPLLQTELSIDIEMENTQNTNEERDSVSKEWSSSSAIGNHSTGGEEKEEGEEDNREGQCTAVLTGHSPNNVWSVDVDLETCVAATGGADGTVRLWCIETALTNAAGGLQSILSRPGDSLPYSSLTSDNRRLSSAAFKKLMAGGADFARCYLIGDTLLEGGKEENMDVDTLLNRKRDGGDMRVIIATAHGHIYLSRSLNVKANTIITGLEEDEIPNKYEGESKYDGVDLGSDWKLVGSIGSTPHAMARIVFPCEGKGKGKGKGEECSEGKNHVHLLIGDENGAIHIMPVLPQSQHSLKSGDTISVPAHPYKIVGVEPLSLTRCSERTSHFVTSSINGDISIWGMECTIPSNGGGRGGGGGGGGGDISLHSSSLLCISKVHLKAKCKLPRGHLCSVAVLLGSTVGPLMVCGDSKGSIHAFDLSPLLSSPTTPLDEEVLSKSVEWRNEKEEKALELGLVCSSRIHGNDNVTDIVALSPDEVYTTGRNGVLNVVAFHSYGREGEGEGKGERKRKGYNVKLSLIDSVPLRRQVENIEKVFVREVGARERGYRGVFVFGFHGFEGVVVDVSARALTFVTHTRGRKRQFGYRWWWPTTQQSITTMHTPPQLREGEIGEEEGERVSTPPRFVLTFSLYTHVHYRALLPPSLVPKTCFGSTFHGRDTNAVTLVSSPFTSSPLFRPSHVYFITASVDSTAKILRISLPQNNTKSRTLIINKREKEKEEEEKKKMKEKEEDDEMEKKSGVTLMGTMYGHSSTIRAVDTVTKEGEGGVLTTHVVTGGGLCTLVWWAWVTNTTDSRITASYKDEASNCRITALCLWSSSLTRKWGSSDLICGVGRSDGVLELALLNTTNNTITISPIKFEGGHSTTVLALASLHIPKGRGNRLLFSSSTDGCVLCWYVDDSSAYYGGEEGVKERNGSILPIQTIRVHQSGVNDMSVKLLDDGNILLASVGDDQAVTLSLLIPHISYEDILHSKSNNPFTVVSTNIMQAHSSSVTAVEMKGNIMVTTGTDRRLNFWRVWVSSHHPHLKLIAAKLTCVADASALAMYSTDNECLVAVVGVGMEVVWFSNNEKNIIL